MASVNRDAKTGLCRVFFMLNGRRRSVRIGQATERQANEIAGHVQELVSAMGYGRSVHRVTASWLAGVSDDLNNRLAVHGLAERREAALLGPFVAKFIVGRATELKPRTLVRLHQAEASLMAHFTANRPVRDLTESDAHAFRAYLIGAGYAEATVRKRCADAGTIMRYAMRLKLADSNPFDAVPTASVASKHRAYISESDAGKVYDALPDAQWRLLFALARWGGTRVVSEPMRLTWADVDWEHKRLTIHSAKTEHLEGHECRQIPLWGRIERPLQEVFDAAPEGERYVLPMLQHVTSAGLRKPLLAAIQRAGVKPWRRLWHNLRSSRQTDLEQKHPTHVVCAWLGNSPTVAAKHYLQLTDTDFDMALKAEGVETCAEQQVTKQTRTEQHEPKENGTDAHVCACSADQVAPPGFEPGTRRL